MTWRPWASLRRRLKATVALGLGWLAGLFVRRSPELPPRRILVIRIDERLGNVLLTTPLIATLQRAYPAASVDVLVAGSKERLLHGIADTIPFRKKDLFRRPWRLARTLWALRRRRYDIAIDASHWHHFSASSALLSAWTGAPVRIAHDRGRAVAFASHAVPAPESVESELATKQRLLGPLGIFEDPPPLETRIGEGGPPARRMEEWLSNAGLGEARLVGLAPGARKPDHRVDPRVFSRLGREAHELGCRAVVLWGPGEEHLRDAVLAGVGELAVAAPPTNLEELAAVMRRCSAVIANDTGQMHLAVACGVPTLALFRGAEPRRWGHAAPPHAVVPTDGLEEARVIELACATLRRLLGEQRARRGVD